MHSFKYSSLIFLLGLTFGNCNKDTLGMDECDSLRSGLIAEDFQVVSNALRNDLTIYSRENLNRLAAKISDRCNIATSIACFECIYTYPGQSELHVSFNQSDTLIEKIIDISYTS